MPNLPELRITNNPEPDAVEADRAGANQDDVYLEVTVRIGVGASGSVINFPVRTVLAAILDPVDINHADTRFRQAWDMLVTDVLVKHFERIINRRITTQEEEVALEESDSQKLLTQGNPFPSGGLDRPPLTDELKNSGLDNGD